MRPPRYDRGPPVEFYPSRKPEALMELALAHGFYRDRSVSGEHQWTIAIPETTEDRWKHEPALVREFVFLAMAEGLRPTSVDAGRQVVLRYGRFLEDHLGTTLEEAGWTEYTAYKLWLAQSGIARPSARTYLLYIHLFYRLRAQTYQDSGLLETYMRIRAIGSGRAGRSRGWKPLGPTLVRRLIEASEGEDHAFLMTLLYTAGRAQFYGLKVDNLDLARGELTVEVKGGKEVTIPLHPVLARVLEKHIASRGYDSPFLFRNGKDISNLRGQRANRQNAWRICKRVQRRAGIKESVHPHRFRKTLAAYVRRTGTDPQVLLAVLANARLDRTLEDYTHLDLDEVKRRYARLDPLDGYGDEGADMVELRDSLEGLRGLGPEGKEHAWALLVDGLLGLMM